MSGLAVHDLAVDELIAYRERIEAVDVGAVAAAAKAHLHVDAAAVVLVGDVDAFGAALEAAGLGPMVIERDPIPESPPSRAAEAEVQGPVDVDDQEADRRSGEPPASRDRTG